MEGFLLSRTLSAPPIEDTTTHDSAMNIEVACLKYVPRFLISVLLRKMVRLAPLIGLLCEFDTRRVPRRDHPASGCCRRESGLGRRPERERCNSTMMRTSRTFDGRMMRGSVDDD